MTEIKKWYALYTKPRSEFKAELQLNSIDIESYLPKVQLLKKWSDRKKKVTEPLFRGYIFIRADERERLLALEQNAIVKTIFFNGKPSAVPQSQIDSLKKMLSNTNDIQVFNNIIKGNIVKIVEGPFSGTEGVVYNVSKNESMLAVNIDIINRSVVVKLPSGSVVKK
ncbi:MAG: UpxY family transcription antiterminator [Melioribacteraceae bacterium]|nr:UpxY family transcription antiterminator [Melioribacteraceae bacterium]